MNQDEPLTVTAQDVRDLVFMLKKKWWYKWQWHRDIPPVKVIYAPQHKTHNFVLVEGVEQYQTARILGLDTINCQFVGEAEPVHNHFGLWEESHMENNFFDTEINGTTEMSLMEK